MLRQMLDITQQEMAKEIAEKTQKYCKDDTYCKMENGNIPFQLTRAKIVYEYINKKLTEKGCSQLSFEAIFFTDGVPNMEQKE